MVNLLGGARRAPRWAPLSAPALDRARRRLATIASFEASALAALSAEAAEGLAADLDELDERPDPASAEALLAQLDAMRARLGAPPTTIVVEDGAPVEAPSGAWLVHRPGRSLRTGEAEIASRGFFDVADRPPLALWLEVLVGEAATPGAPLAVGILCRVPAPEAARARAGCEACPSGALWTEAQLSSALLDPLASLATG